MEPHLISADDELWYAQFKQEKATLSFDRDPIECRPLW